MMCYFHEWQCVNSIKLHKSIKLSADYTMLKQMLAMNKSQPMKAASEKS